jgi:hypothetical protein
MDKILRINMGADGGPEIKVDSMDDYAGFGGRGPAKFHRHVIRSVKTISWSSPRDCSAAPRQPCPVAFRSAAKAR